MELNCKQTTRYKDKVIRLEALPDKPLHFFTPEEDDLIRKYYPTKGVSIASILGKTKPQVSNRASKLGIKRI